MTKMGRSMGIVMLLFCTACTGLLHSAKVNDVEGINRALDGGTDVDFRDNQGRTALIIAAYSRHPDAVALLCRRGADVNAKDNNGCTALIYAAYYDVPEVAQVLLDGGADRSITDRHGKAPLDYARDYGYKRLIDLLDDGR